MNAKKPHLIVNELYKTFEVNNKRVTILKDINFALNKGQFLSIVGHSGCGKSTLLKIIAGLEGYEKGTVKVNGKKVVKSGLDRLMVFQDHRLFPWMKIKDNITIGLRGYSKSQKDDIAYKYLRMVNLKGFENAYPGQLSGGMSQRAAIARALINRPEILLLDEPFGALDALTRIQMQEEIMNIWQTQKTTMILVTHDIEEAIYLGERVIVMSSRPGTIGMKLNVDIAKDRASQEFAYYKSQIYGYFFKHEKKRR
ncbi:MAG: ABC transporter ATP-binding protein [Clostridiales bacterium]|jgi:ABC-type nitrate/sulfonate/bicarbonate transport system ATPase subunit|nr:ABC transporter ATP-binding protein [Clostridiales bacterium]